MGVASLILGILSAIIGVIPICNYIAFVPALVGLGLGIGEIVVKSKKKESKGMGIAGTVLSAIAIIFIAFWTFVIGIAAMDSEDDYTNSSIYDSFDDDLRTFYNHRNEI